MTKSLPPVIDVLVVDDSAVVRQLMSSLLVPEVGVRVTTASDPLVAMAKMRRHRPHVILLDLEMPRMDGLTFLKQIMASDPLPVVVCSGFAAPGTMLAVLALAAGAVDIVPKPRVSASGATEDNGLLDVIRAAAQARVGPPRAPRTTTLAGLVLPTALKHPPGPERSPTRTVTGSHLVTSQTGSQQVPSQTGSHQVPSQTGSHRVMSQTGSQQVPSQTGSHRLPSQTGSHRVPSQTGSHRVTTEAIIAIGASTGGTEALRDILRALPFDAPGIVIVQHMPAGFTTAFAEHLNAICKMEVREAVGGDRVLRGRALLARGDRHLHVRRRGFELVVELDDGPHINRHRPSVDVLFRSVAEAMGPNAVGVILTGMGLDGAEGLLAMKRAGASTIAQDESTSVVFGMPKEAIDRGAVDVVLPLPRIAAGILQRLPTLPGVRAAEGGR